MSFCFVWAESRSDRQLAQWDLRSLTHAVPDEKKDALYNGRLQQTRRFR
jgi:hypothetical protein